MGLAKRSVQCDACGASLEEREYGAGFPGWYFLVGLQREGADVVVCPSCRDAVKGLILDMAKKNGRA